MKCFRLVENLHREECGQDLLEYALVLLAVMVAVVAGSNNLATLLGSLLGTLKTRILNAVQ